jgi:glycosyltransferase involved in cell wall biosynthesis
MRIGVVGHHAAPICAPFAGGMESITWYLTAWLARRGHEVTLFAAPGSSVPGVQVVPLDLSWGVSDVARRDVSMPDEELLRAHHGYLALIKLLSVQRGRFDLVQIHALHHLPVALSHLAGTPTVLTLHSPPTPWLESALVAAGTDAPYLVAVSRATRALWSETIDVDEVIHNGVDLDRWPAGAGRNCAAVWCGRLVPEKAPHLAIDAARLAGLSLRLAGPVADRRYFEAEVRPRLGGDVTYLGCLDHADLARLVGDSSVLLQTPRWDEPYCLAAAEAIACGTPVAAFARGGLGEVVDQDGGMLVEPDSIEALAHAALLVRQMSRDRVRAHAQASLSLECTGAAYEALYRRLADSANPSSLADLDEAVSLDG